MKGNQQSLFRNEIVTFMCSSSLHHACCVPWLVSSIFGIYCAPTILSLLCGTVFTLYLPEWAPKRRAPQNAPQVQPCIPHSHTMPHKQKKNNHPRFDANHEDWRACPNIAHMDMGISIILANTYARLSNEPQSLWCFWKKCCYPWCWVELEIFSGTIW